MSNDSPFSLKTLLEQCGGNKDIGKVILDEFLIQLAADTKELEACLASGDLGQVGKVGHRLKGTASVLGAEVLHSLCFTLEIAGKNGNAEEAAETYAALIVEADRCAGAVPGAKGQL